jgi:hypothetical protein
MGEVTECVNGREPREWQRVYGELRVLGARVLCDERSVGGGVGGGEGRDLTGVVHEAWLKLCASPPAGGVGVAGALLRGGEPRDAAGAGGSSAEAGCVEARRGRGRSGGATG